MSRAGTAPGEGQGDGAATMLSDAVALFRQAWHTGDADALEQAVTGFQDARALSPSGDAVHESAEINLANALVVKFARTGDAGLLDEAIALLPKPFTDRNREADRLAALGWAQQQKAAGSGDRALMNKAVASRQRALNKTRKSDPAYPDRLTDLGNALILQYTLTGDRTDLVRAVGDLEGAVARTSAGDPKAAGLLSSLGNALIAHARVTGTLGFWRALWIPTGRRSGPRRRAIRTARCTCRISPTPCSESTRSTGRGLCWTRP